MLLVYEVLRDLCCDRVPSLMGPQQKGLQGGQVLGGVREPDLGSSPWSRAHTAFLISSVFTSAFYFLKKERKENLAEKGSEFIEPLFQ